MSDDKMTTVWDFVTKYYPKYYSSNEIMENDDLQKLVDQEYQEPIEGTGETGDGAWNMLQSRYGGDIENPQILIDFQASCADIYERAIQEYVDSQINTISVPWHTDDVIGNAKDRELGDITEEQAFEILEIIKTNHDSGIGINWEVITQVTENYLERRR